MADAERTGKTARTTKRLNITLPDKLAAQLEELVPRGERNRLIVGLLERELRRKRLLLVLERSAGAWTDENHPDLMTVEDVNRYVRRLRDTWRVPSWDEVEADVKAHA